MQEGLPLGMRQSIERMEVPEGSRIGRQDRHSKICTSKGARERRIRLSANTAIEFYDVQDRLGYDRPSNAIDWLMKEAKSAIDALNAEVEVPVPATPTIFKPSEAFHRTSGGQVWNHEQNGGLYNYPFGLINPTSPLDFSWIPNDDTGEGLDFIDREPLQSSFQPTPNNEFTDDDEEDEEEEGGFLRFHFQPEIQAETSLMGYED